MRQVSVLCFMSIFSAVAAVSPLFDKALSKNYKSVKMVNGIQFTGLSRGALLKLLATFEQDINARLTGKKLKPVFNAEFVNSKDTKPHIFPFYRRP